MAPGKKVYRWLEQIEIEGGSNAGVTGHVLARDNDKQVTFESSDGRELQACCRNIKGNPENPRTQHGSEKGSTEDASKPVPVAEVVEGPRERGRAWGKRRALLLNRLKKKQWLVKEGRASDQLSLGSSAMATGVARMPEKLTSETDDSDVTQMPKESAVGAGCSDDDSSVGIPHAAMWQIITDANRKATELVGQFGQSRCSGRCEKCCLTVEEFMGFYAHKIAGGDGFVSRAEVGQWARKLDSKHYA